MFPFTLVATMSDLAPGGGPGGMESKRENINFNICDRLLKIYSRRIRISSGSLSVRVLKLASTRTCTVTVTTGTDTLEPKREIINIRATLADH